MRALPTQFDTRRLTNAVATPTCSSCCCCCCCLATSIASSTLLTQRIAKEGKKHEVPGRHLLTIMAALFVPIVGVLVYFGYWTLNMLLRSCHTTGYEYNSSGYTVCFNTGGTLIFPLMIIAPLLVLWFLYTRVHIVEPLKRAVLVTTLIGIAFAAEFWGGAFLILSGAGGVIYLIMVPIIIGWITVWYHHHIGKEVSEPQPTENHGQEPPAPSSTPQQAPPAASAQ